MLKVANLNVSIGPIPIIRDASLSVNEGEMCGLIGRNGAGKTTLLRALMGAIPATGKIELGHVDLLALPAHRRAGHGVGYMPEDRRLVPEFTVEENIRECRYYILVPADNWGPPERALERDYRLALACAADPALPMQQAVLLLRTQPDGSPSPFAATLDAAGLPYTAFTTIEDFQQALLGILPAWLAADSAPAGSGGVSA